MDGAKHPTGDLQPGASPSFACEVCKGHGEYFHPCPECGGTAECLECGSELRCFECDCEGFEACPWCKGTGLINWCECWDDNWISLGVAGVDFHARRGVASLKKGMWKKLKKAKPTRLTIRFNPDNQLSATSLLSFVYRPPRPRNNGGTE